MIPRPTLDDRRASLRAVLGDRSYDSILQLYAARARRIADAQHAANQIQPTKPTKSNRKK